MPKGYIVLKDSEILLQGSNNKYAYMFHIQQRSPDVKIFAVRAESQQEMSRWVKAIRAHQHFLIQRRPPL